MKNSIVIILLMVSSLTYAVEPTVTVPWQEFDDLYKKQITQSLEAGDDPEPDPVITLEQVQYDLKIVDAQATLAAQIAEASGEREPANTGLGNQPARCGKTESLGFSVHIGPSGTAFDHGDAPHRVDMHGAHLREVDHDASVANSMAGDVMPAAPDRHGQALGSREAHGPDNIRRASASGNGGGASVDHRVPELACAVEIRVALGQHATSEIGPEIVN